MCIGKFADWFRKFADRKDIFTMYRDRLEEFRKEKNITHKKWSEDSGVSVDTINRIIHPENPDKDSPRVNTLDDLCDVLGIELWELFYTGEKSLVLLNAEVDSLKKERDDLVAENGALKKEVELLKNKVNSLKDIIIDTHNYYIHKNDND